MKLNSARKDPAALTLSCCARHALAGPPKRPPAGLAALLCERPFPQPCRGSTPGGCRYEHRRQVGASPADALSVACRLASAAGTLRVLLGRARHHMHR